MRSILVAFGVMVVGLSIAAAQTGTPLGPSVTVTGCVTPLGGLDSAASAGSALGRVGATDVGRAGGGYYTLTNVEHGAGSMPDRPAAGVTTPRFGWTTNASRQGSLMLLVDGDGVHFLSGYVGRKVRVTGTVLQPMTEAADASGSTTTSPINRRTMTEMNQVLNVTALQTVSSTCH